MKIALQRQIGRVLGRGGQAAVVIGVAVLAGCGARPEPSDVLRVQQPVRLELLAFTGLSDFDGDGTLDGYSVRVLPSDAFGDPIKAVGLFRAELYLFRKASSDPRGERIGFWEVGVDSVAAQRQFWSVAERCYRFQLESDRPYPPGTRLVLDLTYTNPFAERLFARQVFELP